MSHARKIRRLKYLLKALTPLTFSSSRYKLATVERDLKANTFNFY